MLARRYPEQTPSPDRLVQTHMDLVRKIAWHLHGRVGRMAEIDDMLQVGYMGLVDAAQRYTPRQGATFAAYAEAIANRRDPFFITPAGGADICNIRVPVRRVADAG